MGAIEVNKNDLLKEMMKSMINFTETATALINRMQDKLGVQNAMHITKDIIAANPIESIKEIQKQLDALEQSSSVVCKCTSSPPIEDDNYNPNEDISIGIEYYGRPRHIKNKKYKYPPNLEKKILEQRRRRPMPCKCDGDEGGQYVDSCLCEEIWKHPALRKQNADFFCPVVQCSSLEQSEIINEECQKFISSEEKRGSKSLEGVSTDSLAGILKPGAYDPNELPQDDTNPFILKGPEILENANNGLGYELFHAMKKFGSNIAQIDSETGETETYDIFLEKCLVVALKLKPSLPRDAILGVLTQNHMDSAVPLLAALFNGNRIVTFNRTMTQMEITSCLQNVTPTIIFVCTSSLLLLKDCIAKAKVDVRIVVFGDDTDHESFSSFLNGNSDEVNNFQVNIDGSPDSTAVLCFTSGTTGEPKAVCLSHKAVLLQCSTMINSGNVTSSILDFSEKSRISSVLFLFCSILNGSTRVIAEVFNPGNVKSLAEKYEVRTMYLLPHQCIELSSSLEPDENLSPLISLVTGGERLTSKITRKLRDQFMGSLICQFYENTELAGFGTLFDLKEPANISTLYCKPQSCGQALDGVWYKIVDLESGKILSDSSPGELHVKSKMIFNGYYVNNTENVQNTDWYKTGDLAYYDKQGRFYFVDRISSLIRCQNNIIIPSKIEDILLSHNCVEMAIVIGVSHNGDDQLVAGMVKLNETQGVSSEELEDFVNKQVPDNEKLQGGVKIVETIPHRNGKFKRYIDPFEN